MERLIDPSPTISVPHLVQVALPVGVDRTFVYEIPPALLGRIRPGTQVQVPFRNRTLTGVVVELGGRRPAGKLRQLSAVPDPAIELSEEMLGFTRWLATYYGAPWGEVLRTALPSFLGRKTRRRRAAADAAVDGAADAAVDDATGAATDAVVHSTSPARLVLTGEQREAVELLHRRLAERAFRVVLVAGVTASGKTEVYMRAAEAAIAAGGQVLVLVPEISISVQLLDCFRLRFGGIVSIFHSDLPDTQRREAWKTVRDGRCRILVGARSALFGPFADLRLVIVDEEHEGAYKQSELPRYHARDAAVQRARLNHALAVLGSATPSLESAYNAEQGRYELVRMRQRVDARPLPAVELADLRRLREERRAELDAERRRQRENRGRQRVAKRLARLAQLPDANAPRGGGGEFRLVPPRPGRRRSSPVEPETAPGTVPGTASGPAPGTVPGTAEPVEPNAPNFVSPLLLGALEEVLERREQAILLVGRRGHSTFVQCTDCGQVSRCPDCEVTLVYHAHGQAVRCHHCGRQQRAVDNCPLCGGESFWYGGVGTQRVEEELERRLPAARILRMDLDTTRRAGSHRRIVRAFDAGKADILLGTQMVAKGLHFPEVTLVGVVSADTQLNLPDFRAGERTFQLLTQVAGRAGRGRRQGRVIIQTLIPDHPAVQAALSQDYDLFFAREMQDRRELGYPPVGVMARFLIDGPFEEDVIQLGDRIRDLAESLGSLSLEIMGPAPLPLARLRKRYRWHVTLLGPARVTVHKVARQVLEAARKSGLPGRVRLNFDPDPVHLL